MIGGPLELSDHEIMIEFSIVGEERRGISKTTTKICLEGRLCCVSGTALESPV